MSNRKSMKLLPRRWQSIERLATVTGSKALKGRSRGRFSWRALFRRVADREVMLLEREGSIRTALFAESFADRLRENDDAADALRFAFEKLDTFDAININSYKMGKQAINDLAAGLVWNKIGENRND